LSRFAKAEFMGIEYSLNRFESVSSCPPKQFTKVSFLKLFSHHFVEKISLQKWFVRSYVSLPFKTKDPFD
jgi:hypothetical protein